VSASGGKPVRVSGVGDRVSDPSFARAGTYLAYSQFTEDTNIWRLELAPGTTRPVGPARRIIYSTQYDGGPGYSPDGKRIVFRSGRSGSNEIWICDDQGRNPIQLTHFGGPLTGTPRWVADGSHITFDSRPDGQAHIYTVDVNGGKPVRITEDPAEHVVASSSSDGKWIYFASNRSGSWQVWKIRFDRSETVQVTEKGGFAALESPDGQYVYYAKGRGLAGLWRVPVAGGEEEPVLEALKPGFWGYWAITRDGIYYVDKDPRDFKASINVYSLTTKQSTKIVDIENPPMIGSSAFAVSPNRRFIAYGQVDQSGSDIMLIDSAHSALR
jgi:Tol biopolymer transport system component